MKAAWELCANWAWLSCLMIAVESPATYIAYAMRSETAHGPARFPFLALTMDIFIQKHLKTLSVFSACVAVAKYATYASLLFMFGWKVAVVVVALRIIVGVADFPLLLLFGVHHKSVEACFILAPAFALSLFALSLWLRAQQ
jgi:hypothetical protein